MTTPSEQTPKTRQELQADIEATRQSLGNTVDSLTEKLDVKKRARDGAADASHRAVEQAKEKPVIPIGVVAAVAVVLGVVIWRRRSR